MLERNKLQLQWMAIRYAVDQIDLAWSLNPEEFEGELYEQKRVEMMTHRQSLLELQDEILERKYALD